MLKIDINNETDVAYKNLLYNQYLALLDMKDIIFRKAENIYHLFFSDDIELSFNDSKIKHRCCNFALLEEKMKEYIGQKQTHEEFVNV